MSIARLLLLIPALAFRTPQDPGSASRPAQPETPARRDPFRSADDRTRAAKRIAKDELRALASVPVLPEMRLRGIIKVSGKARLAAVIEVKGLGCYNVHEGEKLSLTLRAQVGAAGDVEIRPARGESPASRPASLPTATAGVPVVLKIQHVGSDGVVAEVGTLGDLLVIR